MSAAFSTDEFYVDMTEPYQPSGPDFWDDRSISGGGASNIHPSTVRSTPPPMGEMRGRVYPNGEVDELYKKSISSIGKSMGDLSVTKPSFSLPYNPAAIQGFFGGVGGVAGNTFSSRGWDVNITLMIMVFILIILVSILISKVSRLTDKISKLKHKVKKISSH